MFANLDFRTAAEKNIPERRSLRSIPWTESEKKELIQRRTIGEPWNETHKLSRSKGSKTDSTRKSTTYVAENESDEYGEIDSLSGTTSIVTRNQRNQRQCDGVCPAKRRKFESEEHDNAAVQRIGSAQRDDPISERPESDESEEKQSEEERSDQERQEHEQEQHESPETLSREHDKPDTPRILEKQQLNVSHMMEECMKHFTVQSSQLALEKGDKDRLRHELKEKTQKIQEYRFSIETHDEKRDELNRQLALEKGEKDRLRYELHEKTLEAQRYADKYYFFIGTRDKRIDELVKGLKERDEQLKNRDEQLEIANERIVRIKKQKGQIRDRKKKLGDRLSEIIIKSMADRDDDEDEVEKDDDDDDQFSDGSWSLRHEYRHSLS
ncbi:mitochondrial escape protein 2 [Physcia stellaris]|nr:mitochondrial escape protein 2 [Physcia stellaris]